MTCCSSCIEVKLGLTIQVFVYRAVTLLTGSRSFERTVSHPGNN